MNTTIVFEAAFLAWSLNMRAIQVSLYNVRSLTMLWSFILLLWPAMASSQIWNQAQLDNFAKTLQVKWTIKDNMESEERYTVVMTLTNTADEAWTRSGQWRMYISCISMIEPDVLPRPEGVVLEGQGIKVTHLQGSHFQFEPTDDFFDLPPGGKRNIKFYLKYWEVSRINVMPNFYLDVQGKQPRVIQSTVGEELSFVMPLTKSQQVKRYANDRYSPFTVQERYRRYNMSAADQAEDIRVVPKPLHMTVNKASKITVDPRTWKVNAASTLLNEANFLKKITNMSDVETDPQNNVVRLSLGEVTVSEGGLPNSLDNYRLTVDPAARVVDITGKGRSGVFYGVQTLLSLLAQDNNVLYGMDITDSPRYQYRGLHFDVARNFHDKDEVLRLLENMAFYKLNRLHLHLSDDEGWRLEIPGLRDLTEVGAKRCHDPAEERCTYPQLGSGPDETTSGSGFYTKAHYRAILEDANKLHIQIIPEFDMPSHARAAIKAMEVRYRRNRNNGQEEAGQKYRLVEEGDNSRYTTAQMFTDNALNPCMESTYTFIDHVIREVVAMHRDIQPLDIYHFGGDGVGRGAWVNSTFCRNMFKTGNVATQAKQYFFTRVANLTANRNLNLAAWEDSVIGEGGEVFDRSLAKNKQMYAYAWQNIWEWGAAGRAYDMANKGYKVIMAHATHLFLDHPYEPDPEERGYYWATRFTDAKKIFRYTPGDLYSLIDVRTSGAPITKKEACGEDNKECPDLQKPENIAGMTGCLWSETSRTRDHVDSRLFPRLLSLAERAWHKASWEGNSRTEAGMAAMKADWDSFARLLGSTELRRLDARGIKYRIPLPGAREEKGFLTMSAAYPGLRIEHSKDDGATWFTDLNNVLVRPTDTILLRTRSADLYRHSRVVKLHGVEALPLVVQTTLDYMAENIVVRFAVEDNFQDGASTYLASITLKNSGKRDIEAGNWGIYFVSIYDIPKEQLSLDQGNVTITQVKGSLFKIEPTQGFEPLKAGGTRTLRLQIKNWSVAKTDAMPNWYVWSEGLQGRTISSTRGPEVDFVADFNTVNKWKRYNLSWLQDRYDPYSVERRFMMAKPLSDKTAPSPIIPTPVTMVTDADKTLDFASLATIVTHTKFELEAKYLKGALQAAGHSTSLSISSSPPSSRYIQLSLRDPRVSIEGRISTSPDAYSLVVDPTDESIRIWATTRSGIFYGIQSLLALTGKAYRDGKLPKTTIEDAPRFQYRGMHLDVSRNFHSKETVLKLLEAMAMYKLNKFHFHLTDDEGWRIEIPGLPELTQIGGQRCYDVNEEKCIISQLGSGPDTTTSGSGFYTVDDYKEILRFASARHIEVIPEIDSPGHAHAAIKAMLARRRRLFDAGDLANADTYNLVDLNDHSEYLSVQLFRDNAINPCITSTYTFIRRIVDQFVNMHKDISPLKTFHFGGDEVAKGAWVKSPECKALLAANVSLKEYFTQRVSSMTSDSGLNLGGWEDGLMESVHQPFNRSLLRNANVFAYAWDNVWEWGVSARAYQLANSGYKVVLAHGTHLYFDHPYEPDPEERGYYWAARYIDTKKTFGYMPDTLYDNVDVRRNGDPMSKTELCGEDGSNCPPLKNPGNVVGMQGHLWSETIRTPDHAFYMVFPRLLALAERAWHKADWESMIDDPDKQAEVRQKDWMKFANTLGQQEFPALDRMNIPYRVPPPGASFSGKDLIVLSPYPGLSWDVSTDGGKSWSPGSPRMTFTSKHIQLVLKSADGKRRSRAIRMKVPYSDRGVATASAPVNSFNTSLLSILVLSISLSFLSIIPWSSQCSMH